MIFYDEIGNNYNITRCADVRITKNLISLLNCPVSSKIIDIGAGTGNYSYELAEYYNTVYALEPSEVMIKQGKKHINLKWFNGFAENIPFEDDFFDGAVCTLASHHFSSMNQSFKEIHRILKPGSNFVMFTFDARKTESKDWLREYFEQFYKIACDTAPSQEFVIKNLKDIYNNEINIIPFRLPYDLTDGFFYSAWKYPERYLNKDFRKGISVFSMSSEELVDSVISRLEFDLKEGIWDNKYKHIRNLNEYDGGYYFISVKKV